MRPDPKLKKIIKDDYGKFFIVKVQDLIKLSRLPVPPTKAVTHTLIFITEGIATMKIGFHKVIIRKNECLIVPAGQVFSYEKYEVNKGYIANFDDKFLIGKFGNSDLVKEFEFLNVWANPVIKPNQTLSRSIKNTLNRILTEYSINGLNNKSIIQSYFIAALCELSHAYKPLSKSTSTAAINLTNQFKQLIHKHIKELHKPTDYAKLLTISPNHLNKTVKEVTGKTATACIEEILITEAKVLLIQTKETINSIATELGILDQSYFSRLFKKLEGKTPLQFRKMIEIS